MEKACYGVATTVLAVSLFTGGLLLGHDTTIDSIRFCIENGVAADKCVKLEKFHDQK